MVKIYTPIHLIKPQFILHSNMGTWHEERQFLGFHLTSGIVFGRKIFPSGLKTGSILCRGACGFVSCLLFNEFFLSYTQKKKNQPQKKELQFGIEG